MKIKNYLRLSTHDIFSFQICAQNGHFTALNIANSNENNNIDLPASIYPTLNYTNHCSSPYENFDQNDSGCTGVRKLRLCISVNEASFLKNKIFDC